MMKLALLKKTMAALPDKTKLVIKVPLAGFPNQTQEISVERIEIDLSCAQVGKDSYDPDGGYIIPLVCEPM